MKSLSLRAGSKTSVWRRIGRSLLIGFIWSAVTVVVSAQNAVSTLAGTALLAGLGDATGSAARFHFSATAGVVVDHAGNLYVADGQNNVIRKITAGGAVVVYAGSATGASGYVDNTGTLARFNNPQGLAIDGADTLYVADTGNHVVRVITSGVVTTLAGSGTAGFTNASGTSAQFHSPGGIAVAPSSGAATTVFVADTLNNAVRQIVVSGAVVTTLAGSNGGTAGYRDASGTNALFAQPGAVVANSTGNTLYLADTGNNVIRRITIASGSANVATLAGSSSGAAGYAEGLGTVARFSAPTGIALDSLGNVVVADSGNQVLRSVTSGGLTSLLAGSPLVTGATDDFATTGAKLNGPSGIAVVSSSLTYFVDAGNDTVREIAPAAVVAIVTNPVNVSVAAGGTATFTVATAGNPAATYQWQRQRLGDAAFANLMEGASYTGTTSATLSIAGATAVMNGDTFRVVATNGLGSATSTPGQLTVTLGPVISTWAGTAGVRGAVDAVGSAAKFSAPSSIVVTPFGTAYVADTANHAIRFIATDGTVSTFAGQPGVPGTNDGSGSAAHFNSPTGLAIDSNLVLYVADAASGTIRVIQPDGTVSTRAGTPLATGSADGLGAAAQFDFPTAIAVDSTGNLYVADTLSDTIRKVDTGANVTTLAGSPGMAGSLDSTGAAARFSSPSGIAVDSSGNVYVADTQNSTIRMITPGGVVTTIAGSPGAAGSLDATGTAARFNNPKRLYLVGTSLYVADTGNDTIRLMNLTSGVVTTVAGFPGLPGTADGPALSARFNQPSGVAADSAGNIYVADTQNQAIRRSGFTVAPAVQNQPVSQRIDVGGTGSFSVVASGFPAPLFQWQRQPAGTTGFVNLSDGSVYGGTATPNLTVTNATAGMSGDQFRVSISNLVGPSVVSNAAILTVQNIGPTIAIQPTGLAVNPGGAFSLTVTASGTPPLTYQWKKDGAAIVGATNATLVVSGAQLANGGAYTVLVSNAFGVTTSNPATVWINTAPAVSVPPRPQVALVGGIVTFMTTVTGSSDMTYQWRKDGVAIPGATGSNLLLGNVATSSAGLYDVVITNGLGSTTSTVAQLTILPVAAAPVITSQPASQSVPAGSSVTLSVAAAGAPGPNYQWRKNGAVIAGANNPALSLTNVQPGDGANYDVVVSNSVGATTSATATLHVFGHSYAGVYFGTFGNGLGTFATYIRRDNTGVFLGILPSVPAGLVTLGLAIDDSGKFSFSQAASLTFGAMTVSGTISNNGTISGTVGGAASGTLAGSRSADSGPTQALAGVYLAGSTSSAGDVVTIADAANQAYAIVQAGSSVDGGVGGITPTGQVGINTGRTVILETISAANGTASATVTGMVTGSFTGATDTALALQRLANISSRAKVGSGDAVEIAGFVISGTDAKPVLIRAVGPTLARQYNIAGALSAPRLDLYRGTTPIATNTNVNNSADAGSIQAAAARAGAFAFAPNAADSALLVTLAPGLYSAQVSGADGGSGVALVEVYDLSAPAAGQKVINISTRAFAASGDNTLIAGVIVTGSVPKRVLVRAVGPGLANYAVTGWLPQPVLSLTTLAGQPIAQNTGWSTSSDAAAIAAAGVQTGAFPLIAGDSGLIVTLAPGAYSAQVSGANGSSGIALVEIYELQ